MVEGTKDPFLNDNKAVERLVMDYMKYGKLIIAYDYDSTVYDWHKRGDTFELVMNLLRECRDYAQFIVYTHSNDDRHGEIIEYLDSHDLPWDTINEGIIFVNDKDEGKLFYSHFLDDRAGLRSAYLILDKALSIIKEAPTSIDEAILILKERGIIKKKNG